MKRLLNSWPFIGFGLIASFTGLMLVPDPEANTYKVDAAQYIITAPTPTTTTTTALPVDGNCDAIGVFAVSLGWPVDQISTLKKVAFRESRCWANMHNTTDLNGGSYGYLQVNGYWCLPNQYWPTGYLQAHGILESCAELLHPKTNLLAALQIWHEAGNSWQSWNTAN